MTDDRWREKVKNNPSQILDYCRCWVIPQLHWAPLLSSNGPDRIDIITSMAMTRVSKHITHLFSRTYTYHICLIPWLLVFLLVKKKNLIWIVGRVLCQKVFERKWHGRWYGSVKQTWKKRFFCSKSNARIQPYKLSGLISFHIPAFTQNAPFETEWDSFSKPSFCTVPCLCCNGDVAAAAYA